MKLLYLILPFALSTSFAHQDIKTYKFNFDTKDSFTVAYADYPKGQEAFYELKSEALATLPREITSSSKGLKISGNNHSDDLFMFAYKKITRLKPNTQYQVSFSVEFASNGPVGSSGIGGSPGDGVYVKIGAVTEKPRRYLDEEQMYRMVLDKGNQASDGVDMIMIGNLAVDIADDATDYRLKTLPYQPDAQMQDKLEHYIVTTNARGEVWLVFGTDSGYEGLTKVYYTNLTVGFKEMVSLFPPC